MARRIFLNPLLHIKNNHAFQVCGSWHKASPKQSSQHSCCPAYHGLEHAEHYEYSSPASSPSDLAPFGPHAVRQVLCLAALTKRRPGPSHGQGQTDEGRLGSLSTITRQASFTAKQSVRALAPRPRAPGPRPTPYRSLSSFSRSSRPVAVAWGANVTWGSLTLIQPMT